VYSSYYRGVDDLSSSTHESYFRYAACVVGSAGHCRRYLKFNASRGNSKEATTHLMSKKSNAELVSVGQFEII
jgi:hypothetical protein